MYKVANILSTTSVEDLKKIGRSYFDLTDPEVSELFDFALDVFFGARISNDHLFGIVQRTFKSAMVHLTKEDDDQQGENNDPLENLIQRVLVLSSSIPTKSG